MIQTSGALQIIDLRKKVKSSDIKLIESSRGAEAGYRMLSARRSCRSAARSRQSKSHTPAARRSSSDIQDAEGWETPSRPDRSHPGSDRVPHESRHPGAQPQEGDRPEQGVRAQARSADLVRIPHPGRPGAHRPCGARPALQRQGRHHDDDHRGDPDRKLIKRAQAGNFQQLGFRNHPGGDPDTQYVWWHSGRRSNFGRINDP